MLKRPQDISQKLYEKGHPICKVCDLRNERHFLHSGKCIRCLSLKQTRVYVPFIEFSNYYLLKHGHEMPAVEVLSPEEFERFETLGILPTDTFADLLWGIHKND